MKLQSLKSSIEIFANVGVVLGLVLLVFELNQNNALLRNEVRYNLVANRVAELNQVGENEEIAQLLVKETNGVEVTEVDALRIRSLHKARLINWEWDYEQVRDKVLLRENIPVEAWVGSFRQSRRLRENWPDYKKVLTSDFITFMEENIVSQLE